MIRAGRTRQVRLREAGPGCVYRGTGAHVTRLPCGNAPRHSFRRRACRRQPRNESAIPSQASRRSRSRSTAPSPVAPPWPRARPDRSVPSWGSSPRGSRLARDDVRARRSARPRVGPSKAGRCRASPTASRDDGDARIDRVHPAEARSMRKGSRARREALSILNMLAPDRSRRGQPPERAHEAPSPSIETPNSAPLRAPRPLRKDTAASGYFGPVRAQCLRHGRTEHA
jgi:hypothetical protein